VTIFSRSGKTFCSAAVQRTPSRALLGICVFIPARIADRFVEDDTETLCLEIMRLSTGFHLKLIEKIPEISEIPEAFR